MMLNIPTGISNSGSDALPSTLPDKLLPREGIPSLRIHFDPEKNILLATDARTGKTVTSFAFSASGKGPLPSGEYLIKVHPKEWRLDAKDSSPNDDVADFGDGTRSFSALRLHPGTQSRGCVTVNRDDWIEVSKMLQEAAKADTAYQVNNSSSVRTIFGDTYNLPKWAAPPKGSDTVVGDLRVGPVGPTEMPASSKDLWLRLLDWSRESPSYTPNID